MDTGQKQSFRCQNACIQICSLSLLCDLGQGNELSLPPFSLYKGGIIWTYSMGLSQETETLEVSMAHDERCVLLVIIILI